MTPLLAEIGQARHAGAAGKIHPVYFSRRRRHREGAQVEGARVAEQMKNPLLVRADEVRTLQRHRGEAGTGEVHLYHAGISSSTAVVRDLPDVPSTRWRLSEETFDPAADVGLDRETLRMRLPGVARTAPAATGKDEQQDWRAGIMPENNDNNQAGRGPATSSPQTPRSGANINTNPAQDRSTAACRRTRGKPARKRWAHRGPGRKGRGQHSPRQAAGGRAHPYM